MQNKSFYRGAEEDQPYGNIGTQRRDVRRGWPEIGRGELEIGTTQGTNKRKKHCTNHTKSEGTEGRRGEVGTISLLVVDSRGAQDFSKC